MNLEVHFSIAFLIRLSFLIFGLFQDVWCQVRYTDTDYEVFTDAAHYVSEGLSPFKRHTYRYTPLLSFLLLPNILIHQVFGKVLFCFLDLITCALIYKIQHKLGLSVAVCERSTYFWLYNPLPIVISTRGNAESIVMCLIMVTVYSFQTQSFLTMGIVYGIAIHFKLYPCIYALSFYFALSQPDSRRLLSLLCPNKRKCIFVFATFIGFAFPTYLSFTLYGREYLNEALLHHLIRKDTRHNFSPYFYFLYLTQAGNVSYLSNIVSFAAFAFQAILIAIASYVFPTAKVLSTCMFVQTFTFVSYNKVCTSQYFLWYLCLLPLSSSAVQTKSAIRLFILWLMGQALWLVLAYCLEFQGQNTFLYVCTSSVIFLGINAYILSYFINFTCNVFLK